MRTAREKFLTLGHRLGLDEDQLYELASHIILDSDVSELNRINNQYEIVPFEIKREIIPDNELKEYIFKSASIIKDILAKYDFSDAYLVGSVARGDNNLYSDIDLLVTDNGEKSSSRYYCELELSGVLKQKVQIIPRGYTSKFNIYEDMDKEGIEL